MLSFVFYYLVAFILVCQGTHAFQEAQCPMGIVPEEVQQKPSKAMIWGCAMAAYGYLSIAYGIVSHLDADFQVVIPSIMNLGLMGIGAYGLHILFGNRMVDYKGQAAEGHGHH